jgi:hypothetical protein
VPVKGINKSPDEKIDSECIDMQIHYVDFLQQSDGMKSLINQMDQSNLDDEAKCCNGLIRKLSPEKASDVLYRNAEKIWFKN